MIPALINLIVYLMVIAILIALVFYVLREIPMPEPINRIVRVAVVVLACLIVILLLLDAFGMGGGGLSLPKVAN